jgi:hypothetical protein
MICLAKVFFRVGYFVPGTINVFFRDTFNYLLIYFSEEHQTFPKIPRGKTILEILFNYYERIRMFKINIF